MRFDLIKDTVDRIAGSNEKKWSIQEETNVKINEKKYPLFPWRFHRRLSAIRSLAVNDKVLQGLCSYKSLRVESYNADIRSMLYQELDSCEWLLDDKLISFYALSNGNKSLSVIFKTKKGILGNIEIAATLSKSTAPITKHELVGEEGMISDRSINEQIPVEAVYMFEESKKEPLTYTDMDFSMIELEPHEVMVVDNVIDLLSNIPDLDLMEKKVKRLNYLVDSVLESVKIGESIVVEEEV